MSKYRQQLETWLAGIEINADKVLEIGGASKPVNTRLKKADFGSITHLDNGAEEAVVSYMAFDINEDLNDYLKGYADSTFDAVFVLEVFEYVWNPVQAIQNIYDLMSGDSVAYISFPAIYPVHNPVDIDFLRYTKNGIIKLLLNAGFKADHINITPRVATEGKNELAAFYRSEGMHPVRHSQLPYDIGYLVKVQKVTL